MMFQLSTMAFSQTFLENLPAHWHIDAPPPATTTVYCQNGDGHHAWILTGIAETVAGEKFWQAFDASDV